MKRTDVYAFVGVAALLLSAWFVGDAIRKNAAATQDLAAATDCANPLLNRRDDERLDCEVKASLRRLDAISLDEGAIIP